MMYKYCIYLSIEELNIPAHNAFLDAHRAPLLTRGELHNMGDDTWLID